VPVLANKDGSATLLLGLQRALKGLTHPQGPGLLKMGSPGMHAEQKISR